MGSKKCSGTQAFDFQEACILLLNGQAVFFTLNKPINTHRKVFIFELVEHSCQEIKFIPHVLLNEDINSLGRLSKLVKNIQGIIFVYPEKETNILD